MGKTARAHPHDMGEFNHAVAGLRVDLAEHPLAKGVMSSDQALLGFKAAIDAALARGSQALTESISGLQVRPSGPCDNRFGRPDNGFLRHTVFVALREDKPAKEVRASGRGSDGDDWRVEDAA